MSKICEICSSKNLINYSYNNHSNKLNIFFILHIKTIIISILSIFKKKYKNKNLFSAFSKISVCEDCGFGKCLNKIDNNDLKNYYSSLFWDDTKFDFFYKESVDQVNRAEGQYIAIKKYLPKKPIKILEIGAGSATLSKILKKNIEIVASDVVEPGDKWKEYYNSINLKKISNFYPDKTISKYDLIIASHWLEHVVNMKSILSNLRNNLNDQGLVFIEVPNCNDEYWNFDIKDIPHIYFFTKISLKKLFSDNGFKVELIQNLGMTNKEFYFSNNFNDLNNELIEEVNESIRNNTYRNKGNVIRMLASKIS